MNFRHKYLVTTARVLLGLIFLASGIDGWDAGTHNNLGVPPDMLVPTRDMWYLGLTQLVKTTEIVTGLMLIIGFLPWLATLILASNCVGIIVITAKVAPQYLAPGIVVSVLTAYLGYAYWVKYRVLFDRA
jgi:uncharacterized membrane protein YphA (DoxX/SURF4 family)